LGKIRGLDVKWHAEFQFSSNSRAALEYLERSGGLVSRYPICNRIPELILNRKLVDCVYIPLTTGGALVHRGPRTRGSDTLTGEKPGRCTGAQELVAEPR
jgi:hypothetical protein